MQTNLRIQEFSFVRPYIVRLFRCNPKKYITFWIIIRKLYMIFRIGQILAFLTYPIGQTAIVIPDNSQEWL